MRVVPMKEFTHIVRIAFPLSTLIQTIIYQTLRLIVEGVMCVLPKG